MTQQPQLPPVHCLSPKFDHVLPLASLVASLVYSYRGKDYESKEPAFFQDLLNRLVEEIEAKKQVLGMNDLTNLVSASVKIENSFMTFLHSYKKTRADSKKRQASTTDTMICAIDLVLSLISIDDTSHHLPIVLLMIDIIQELIVTFNTKNHKELTVSHKYIANFFNAQQLSVYNAFTQLRSLSQQFFNKHSKRGNVGDVEAVMRISMSLSTFAMGFYNIMRQVQIPKKFNEFVTIEMYFCKKIFVLCGQLRWAISIYLCLASSCIQNLYNESKEEIRKLGFAPPNDDPSVISLFEAVRKTKETIFYGSLDLNNLLDAVKNSIEKVAAYVTLLGKVTQKSITIQSIYVCLFYMIQHCSAASQYARAVCSESRCIPNPNISGSMYEFSLDIVRPFIDELKNSLKHSPDTIYYDGMICGIAHGYLHLVMLSLLDNDQMDYFCNSIQDIVRMTAKISIGDLPQRKKLNELLKQLEKEYSTLRTKARNTKQRLIQSSQIDVSLLDPDVMSEDITIPVIVDYSKPSQSSPLIKSSQSIDNTAPTYFKIMNMYAKTFEHAGRTFEEGDLFFEGNPDSDDFLFEAEEEAVEDQDIVAFGEEECAAEEERAEEIEFPNIFENPEPVHKPGEGLMEYMPLDSIQFRPLLPIMENGTFTIPEYNLEAGVYNEIDAPPDLNFADFGQVEINDIQEINIDGRLFNRDRNLPSENISSSPPNFMPNMSSDLPIGSSYDLPPSLPSSVPPSLPSGLPPSFPTNLPPSLPSNLPPSLPTNLPPSLPTNLPSSLPTSPPSSLPSVLPPSLPTNLPPSLPTNLPPSLPTNLPPSLPSNLPPSLPSNLPPSLPSHLPPSLPTNLPPSFTSSPPSSLPSVVPLNLPYNLPSSLPPSLPTNLPPSLPSNLPPGLPPSLPTGLPPSLPSNLPPNLPSMQSSSLDEVKIIVEKMHLQFNNNPNLQEIKQLSMQLYQLCQKL